MTPTRRNILKMGALAAAGAVLPSRVFAQPVAYDNRINPALKARALAAFQARRSQLVHADVMAIADFSRASRDPRFYLMDMRGGMVTAHLCAHGRGSDPQHSGWLEHFSNEVGSEATSNGEYITGDVYQGKYGRSLRLRGLNPSNSNAEARAIVVHSAAYAEPRMVEQFGKLGRSEGCFALPVVSHAETMFRMGPGRLLYADRV